MKYFIDTEFNERPRMIEMISIGIVDENGREYYAVSNELDVNNCNDFVRNEVLSFIDAEKTVSLATMRKDILEFIQPNPVFYGYMCDYDWVNFCWLFGGMADLPEEYPKYCRDLKQILDRLQVPKLEDPVEQHNALADARWNKELYEYLVLAEFDQCSESR